MDPTDLPPPTTLEEGTPLFKLTYEERSVQENKMLVSLFQQIPHFKKYSEVLEKPQDRLLDLLKLFKHEFYSKGQALCHYGEHPRKLWIIVKGRAKRFVPRHLNISSKLTELSIIVPPSKEASLEEPASPRDGCSTPKKSKTGTPMNSNDIIMRNKTLMLSLDINSTSMKKDEKRRKSLLRGTDQRRASKRLSTWLMEDIEMFRKFNMQAKYFGPNDAFQFQLYEILSSGSSFLDLSMSQYSPYESSIVAWSDLHIISIPLKEYMLESKEFAKLAQEKILLLHQIFPDLPEKNLMAIADLVQKRTLRLGEILFNENSESCEFFIIHRGTIELMRNIPYEAKGFEEGSPRPKNVKASVITLTEGNLIGEEMLLDSEKRVFSGKAMTVDTVVYCLSQEALDPIMDLSPVVNFALTKKAKATFKLKLKRLQEAESETQKAIIIREGVTAKETYEKKHLKNDLDHLTRELLQEKLMKPTGSPTHFTVKGEKSPENFSQEAYSELKKLADTKTKAVRNITKIDPRYEFESKSPVFEQIKKQPTLHLSQKSLNEFVVVPLKGHITPSPLWNQAIKGGWLSKKMKGAAQSPTTRTDKDSRDPSVNLSKVLKKSNGMIPLSTKVLGSNNSTLGDVCEEDEELKKYRKEIIGRHFADNLKNKRERVCPINIRVFEQKNGSQHHGKEMLTSGVDRILRREVDELLCSKMADLKNDYTLVKLLKAKKGRDLSRRLGNGYLPTSSNRLLLEHLETLDTNTGAMTTGRNLSTKHYRMDSDNFRDNSTVATGRDKSDNTLRKGRLRHERYGDNMKLTINDSQKYVLTVDKFESELNQETTRNNTEVRSPEKDESGAAYLSKGKLKHERYGENMKLIIDENEKYVLKVDKFESEFNQKAENRGQGSYPDSILRTNSKDEMYEYAENMSSKRSSPRNSSIGDEEIKKIKLPIIEDNKRLKLKLKPKIYKGLNGLKSPAFKGGLNLVTNPF